MLDIGGLVLLLGSLAGAIKGRWMPLWIPQVVALAALAMLIYQGFWKRSRFALIHTATLWVTLSWIAGHMMARSWGDGILMQIPLWTMLLVTPAVKDIADRLEAVGIDDYTIDLERGIVFVYHKGLLEKETPTNQTPTRRSNHMAQTQITLTPNLAKKELIIGIQTGDHGRLLLANIPSLAKADQTVLAGEPTSSQFRAQVEKALSTYVPRPHHVYSILK